MSRKRSKLLLKRTSPMITLPSSRRKTFLSVTPLFRIASPKLRATAQQQSSFPRLTRSKFNRISQGKCKTCLKSQLLNSRNTCEFQKKAYAVSFQRHKPIGRGCQAYTSVNHFQIVFRTTGKKSKVFET